MARFQWWFPGGAASSLLGSMAACASSLFLIMKRDGSRLTPIFVFSASQPDRVHLFSLQIPFWVLLSVPFLERGKFHHLRDFRVVHICVYKELCIFVASDSPFVILSAYDITSVDLKSSLPLVSTGIFWWHDEGSSWSALVSTRPPITNRSV